MQAFLAFVSYGVCSFWEVLEQEHSVKVRVWIAPLQSGVIVYIGSEHIFVLLVLPRLFMSSLS